MAHIQPHAKPPLGIGSILSQSFSLLFARFGLFFLLAFSVQFLFFLLSLAVPATTLSVDPTSGTPSVSDVDMGSVLALGLTGGLLGLVASSLVTGMIVLAAYDAWLGNPSRPRAYIGAALGAIVPLVVLSIVTGLLMGLGFVFLIVPGLYIAATFAVVTPAIVAEGAGFGAMGRSATLTSDYRWGIIGLFVVVFAGVLGIGTVQQFLFGLGATPDIAPGAAPTQGPSPGPLYLLLSAVVQSVTSAFIAVTTAVLFARLKEIKEGVGPADLGRVFD